MKISKNSLKSLIQEEFTKVLRKHKLLENELDLDDSENPLNAQENVQLLMQSDIAPLFGKSLPFYGADQEMNTFKLGNSVYVVSSNEDLEDSTFIGVKKISKSGRLTNVEPMATVTVRPLKSEDFTGFELVDKNNNVLLKVGTDWSDLSPNFTFDVNLQSDMSDHPSAMRRMQAVDSSRLQPRRTKI